ncbi:hypothetical protein DAKH74_048520 [Maudiozyma humilis]|uniref:Uncharacterized protein n=1 Tax=Maudiozyma humilis TaxID=51915 RepID=A0AAV5S471_MAUHU|nr:hypothetical protein DAKH74_048520 [Kazachstania humilis]
MSTSTTASSFDEENSSGSVAVSSLPAEVSTLTSASSFNGETSNLSEYRTRKEYHSSSKVSSTQGVWSSSANSRSATLESPSSPSTNTEDAISRSHEKSTDLTSADSSISVTQTSNQVLTTSKTRSVSERASSINVTSSLADTMFFGNSSSLTTGDFTTSSNIDGSFTTRRAHTTDVGDEYTSVTHTNTEFTNLSTEDDLKTSTSNLHSLLSGETSFAVIKTYTSSTNNNRVSKANEVTHPLNTPTGKYGESNDKVNGDGKGNYGPVNTKSFTESALPIVPDVTQAVSSDSATMVISGSSNSPVVSVYAVETVNWGSRLCIKAISILLPMLLLI